MRVKSTLLLATIVGGLATAPGTLPAAESSDDINALKQQIQELDQKVRSLEQKKQLEAEASEAKAKETPRVVAGSNGLIVSTADSNFVFQVRAVLQVDNRTYFDDGGISGNDGFLLRKARPILQGTAFRDFDFLLVPDFAGGTAQIFDAYANYRYEPWLQLRAGKFKTPVGLELLQSDPATMFNERSLVTDLVPNRDVGFQLWGDVSDGIVSYAAGVFNGVGDARNTGNSDFEDHREFAGRVFLHPFRKTELTALKGLGLGVGGSWGNISSNASGLPNNNGYATDGQQLFFVYTNGVVANGTHRRLSPQAYYYIGPFGLLGEYAISDQRVRQTVGTTASTSLQHVGWHIAGSFVLTGEEASFNGVKPRRNFNPRAGQWGALEMVGRYATLDIDNDAFPLYANPAVSASAAHAWAVGLNWYLNRNLRINASYSHTTFTGGGGAGTTAPATVTRQPESVFFTRLQLVF